MSVAVGLYIGVQPLFGLHFPLCLVVCLPFGLDAIVAYAAANISNPLFAPFIVFAEAQLGSFVMDGRLLSLEISRVRSADLGHLATQTVVGAQVLGVVFAICGGVVAARIATFAQAKRSGKSGASARSEYAGALKRTRYRYRSALAADRNYVAAKLRWDTITRLLYELPHEWGTVFDIGCGRGQLGLFLLELGRIRSLSGIDWDTHKIQTAQRAAAEVATFRVADLSDSELAPCDTVLLIDVLHYLAAAEQTKLLVRIAATLAPGGTLIVRDVDARQTFRSRITRWVEIVGTRLGINRGQHLYFRSRDQLREDLVKLDFDIVETIEMPGLSLDNVLVVARQR